jgi:hypothetical protein
MKFRLNPVSDESTAALLRHPQTEFPQVSQHKAGTSGMLASMEKRVKPIWAYNTRLRDCRLYKNRARRPPPSSGTVPGSGVAAVEVAQPPVDTVLVSIVTAAFSAMAFPQVMVALVFSVMLWSAIIVP